MSSYNYKQLTKKLSKLGFEFYRQGKGSHTIWINETSGIIIPVPNHGGKDIRSGTIREIVKQIGLKNLRDLDNL